MIPLLWRYCTQTHALTCCVCVCVCVRALVSIATVSQSHLDRSQHLVEVKFGHGLIKLLLQLDPMKQLPPLHPDTHTHTHTHTHTPLIKRSTHSLIVTMTTVRRRQKTQMTNKKSQKTSDCPFKLTAPTRCSSCPPSGRSPPS